MILKESMKDYAVIESENDDASENLGITERRDGDGEIIETHIYTHGNMGGIWLSRRQAEELLKALKELLDD